MRSGWFFLSLAAVFPGFLACELFQGSQVGSEVTTEKSAKTTEESGPYQPDEGGDLVAYIDTWQAAPEEDAEEGDEAGDARFIVELREKKTSRSIAGDAASGKNVANRFRDVYQLIAVDTAEPERVASFSQALPALDSYLSVPLDHDTDYHILLLAGHVNDPAAYADAGDVGREKPVLLAAGFQTVYHTTESRSAAAMNVTFSMTPLVIDIDFVNSEGLVRESGRLAKTVGLEERTVWTMKAAIGGKQRGKRFLDDRLGTVYDTDGLLIRDGLAPLKLAENAVSADDDIATLTLLSNAAWVADMTGSDSEIDNVATLADSNDTHGTSSSTTAPSTTAHTTTGIAEYQFTTAEANTKARAWFVMEYAPFGFTDEAAWQEAADGVVPVWQIRSGFNNEAVTGEETRDNGTVALGIVPKPEENGGAISLSGLKIGVYEDGPDGKINPAPIERCVLFHGAYDLNTALQDLQEEREAARYGSYTIVLDTNQLGGSISVHPSRIQLGDDLSPSRDGDNMYDLENVSLVIANASGEEWNWPAIEDTWLLNAGNSVRYEKIGRAAP